MDLPVHSFSLKKKEKLFVWLNPYLLWGLTGNTSGGVRVHIKNTSPKMSQHFLCKIFFLTGKNLDRDPQSWKTRKNSNFFVLLLRTWYFRWRKQVHHKKFRKYKKKKFLQIPVFSGNWKGWTQSGLGSTVSDLKLVQIRLPQMPIYKASLKCFFTEEVLFCLYDFFPLFVGCSRRVSNPRSWTNSPRTTAFLWVLPHSLTRWVTGGVVLFSYFCILVL